VNNKEQINVKAPIETQELTEGINNPNSIKQNERNE